MSFIVVHEFDFFETQREIEEEQLQLFTEEFDEFWGKNVVPGNVTTSILKYKPTKKEERLVVLRDVHSAGAIIGMFLLSYLEGKFFVERFAVMETENVEQFVRNFVSRNMHPVLRVNKKEVLAYLAEKEEFGLQGFNTKPEKEGAYFIITLTKPGIISGLCYVANLFPPIIPSNVTEQIPEGIATENSAQEHDTSRASQTTYINLSPRAEPKNNNPFPTTASGSGVKASGRKLPYNESVSNSSNAFANDEEMAQSKDSETLSTAYEKQLSSNVLNTVLHTATATVSGDPSSSASDDASEDSFIVGGDDNNIVAGDDNNIATGDDNDNNVNRELFTEADTTVMKTRGAGRPRGSLNKKTIHAKRQRK